MNDIRKEMLLEAVWHCLKYILTIVFCVLKLCGAIDWHWIWIFSPLILFVFLKLIELWIFSFLMCIAPRLVEWIERWNS